MVTKHKQRTYSILELAATLHEMPEETSVWIEGADGSYEWGSLKRFRETAEDLLAYSRPSYPAVVEVDSRQYPIGGVDVYGDRVVILLLPELSIPDLSRPSRSYSQA